MGPEAMADNSDGRMPAKLKWDAVSGGVLMLIGAGTLLLGANLRVGTIGRMGPGYLPTSIAIIVIVLGAILLASALFRRAEHVEWPALRPTIVVLACPAIFALLIGRLGLVLTIIIVASIARLADRPKLGVEAVVMPLMLAGFCVVVFHYLLKLPTPLWP